MKKSRFILVALLAVVCLFGCGQEEKKEEGTEKKLDVVVSVFPAYDWTKEILGDRAEDVNLTMLLDNGVDLHSYQPSVDDVMKISSCDVFVYVGGDSDLWAEEALEEAANPDMKVVNLMEILKKTPERIETGLRHDGTYDEHVWLSVKNAKLLCDGIAESLCEADPKHADEYKENLKGYQAKLDDLDAQFEEAISGAENKTLVFGDRYPFGYLAADYGLECDAAYDGCSAETEASFDKITDLANLVDELNLHAVMTIEHSDGKIAETIVENTQSKDQEILTLDSMQGTDLKEAESGASYLKAMEDNLEVIKEALK